MDTFDFDSYPSGAAEGQQTSDLKEPPARYIRRITVEALQRLGGADYLVRIGQVDAGQLISLLRRLLPQQVEADVRAEVAHKADPSEVEKSAREKLAALIEASHPASNVVSLERTRRI